MVGGGRKKFTRDPIGEQFPCIPSTPEETTVEVFGFDPLMVPPGFKGSGGGTQALSRMVLAHRVHPAFRVIRGGKT